MATKIGSTGARGGGAATTLPSPNATKPKPTQVSKGGDPSPDSGQGSPGTARGREAIVADRWNKSSSQREAYRQADAKGAFDKGNTGRRAANDAYQEAAEPRKAGAAHGQLKTETGFQPAAPSSPANPRHSPAGATAHLHTVPR